MVTEEWNPAVRARSWIQLLWPKKPKLANIKSLSLTYYNFYCFSLIKPQITFNASLDDLPFASLMTNYSETIGPGIQLGKENGLTLLLDAEVYDYAFSPQKGEEHTQKRPQGLFTLTLRIQILRSNLFWPPKKFKKCMKEILCNFLVRTFCRWKHEKNALKSCSIFFISTALSCPFDQKLKIHIGNWTKGTLCYIYFVLQRCCFGLHL